MLVYNSSCWSHLTNSNMARCCCSVSPSLSANPANRRRPVQEASALPVVVFVFFCGRMTRRSVFLGAVWVRPQHTLQLQKASQGTTLYSVLHTMTSVCFWQRWHRRDPLCSRRVVECGWRRHWKWAHSDAEGDSGFHRGWFRNVRVKFICRDN